MLRKQIEREIDEELRFHLEMREREYLARGLPPADARDAALARFGDVDGVRDALRVHEFTRHRRRERKEYMTALLQDLRFGARKLRQAPLFSVAVIAVLALGIGVNAAVFSAVDAALLSPLPFRDAERMTLIHGISMPSKFPGADFEPPKRAPDYSDLATLRGTIEAFGAYAPGGLNITGTDEPTRVRIAMVTPSLFPMLGVTPQLGRTFAPAEEDPANANVVVLSHALWQGKYGGDPGVLGRTIHLDGIAHTVVGVMRPRFAFPASAELWIPLTVPFVWSGVRREAVRSYLPETILAKLAPDASIASARTQVAGLFAPYVTKERPMRTPLDELVMPWQETLVKNRRTALLVLMGAAALVLLVACANVANLQLGRISARRREIAVRVALGASRARVVQGLLAESVLLAAMAGVAGIVVAWISLGVLTALMPSQLADVVTPTLSGRVLLFSVLLASVTGIAFGVWPAFGATRRDVATTIRLGGLGTTSADGSFMRRALVVSEMAFAVMLLVGATLMLRSFDRLVRTDTGVDYERVGIVELALSAARYRTAEARGAFYDQVLARLRRNPSVESAAVINEVPLRGEWGIGISAKPEGKPAPEGDDAVFPQYLRVTPDYFRTMRIRMTSGRSLTAQDDTLNPAAVINEAMAKALWPGENALGKRFSFGSMPGRAPTYITVVGIIGDVRSQSIEEEPMPQMYLPFSESPNSFAGIVVRGRGEGSAILGALHDAVRATDPQQATYNLRMLRDVVDGTMRPRRTNTVLIAAFGFLAVALAVVGVYAVIAYGVTQRTREIGIRIALGARLSGVMSLVMREGVALALVGVAIGLAGAWSLSRVMESLVYGVGVRDPLTFVLAPLALLAMATLATVIPARRAARTDPMEALRAE